MREREREREREKREREKKKGEKNERRSFRPPASKPFRKKEPRTICRNFQKAISFSTTKIK